MPSGRVFTGGESTPGLAPVSTQNFHKKPQTSTKVQHASAFLSVKDAAYRFGVSAMTITRWCESGKLPAMAVPYGSRVTYRINPMVLEMLQVSLPAQKAAEENKPIQPHCDYVGGWEAAMAGGTLTGKAFSPRTVECYLLYVRKFVEKHPVVSVEILEKELLLIPAKHYAKRDKLWKSLLCFGKYLIRHGALDKGFLEGMKLIQPKRHLPPKRFTVDEEEIEGMLAACNTAQERLMLLLLAYTGLRASEACALKWGDVDLVAGCLRVRLGKGNKNRLVGLTSKLVDAMAEHRAKVGGTPSTCVFLNRDGNPMDRSGLYQRVKRLGELAEVKVSPHALRRAFVTINANKGRPLQMLQMACGHSDIKTTMGYCLTAEQEVINAMRGWD